MNKSIKEYARYNLWANKQIVLGLERFSEELWTKRDKSSFGSVSSTVVHVWWAEKLWTQRLSKVTPDYRFPSSVPKETTLSGWIADSKKFTDLILNFNQSELEEIINYSTSKGSKYSNARINMCHHCINHSTYHRGQLVLMMRLHGFTDVPSTDYITFLNLMNNEA